MLCLFSSLTNCDPGDIFKTLEKVELQRISCNVISLSASIYVLQQLSKITGGQFQLAKDKDHLEDLLTKFVVPTSSIQE